MLILSLLISYRKHVCSIGGSKGDVRDAPPAAFNFFHYRPRTSRRGGGTLLGGYPAWGGYPAGGYPGRGGTLAGGYPGRVPPPARSGGGYPVRTTEGVFTTRRAVCLLRSRRRTFLFSCSFGEKFGQVIGWCPTLGLAPPSSGKSWIRHYVVEKAQWIPHASCHKYFVINLN